jgi:hypothetical protein
MQKSVSMSFGFAGVRLLEFRVAGLGFSKLRWCDISPLSFLVLDASDPLQVGLRSDLKFNLSMELQPCLGFN